MIYLFTGLNMTCIGTENILVLPYGLMMRMLEKHSYKSKTMVLSWCSLILTSGKLKTNDMRFTKEKDTFRAYVHGTDKIVEKFLFFPVKIDGEIRWLEKAIIQYRVEPTEGTFSYRIKYKWFPAEFLNK
jgi:hypothetical protein